VTAAEAPTAVQVWTDKVDDEVIQYLISPVWFIPDACVQWFKELEFVRDVGQRLALENLSCRWWDAYNEFKRWMHYWEGHKPESLEYD